MITMNKLTITDKVFVPVNVNEKDFPLEEVCCINDTNMLVGRINYMGDGVIRPIVYCEDEHQEMGNVTHWLKEETNKYVLSKEELIEFGSNFFRQGERFARHDIREIETGEKNLTLDLPEYINNTIIE
jgi:hypothetical protein